MVQRAVGLDEVFAALGDPTRRGILEQLRRGDASISELAGRFGMSLPGIAKHVQLLEQAALLETAKVGRVRRCRLGPRRLDAELDWITSHRRQVAARLDQLGEFLERTQGDR